MANRIRLRPLNNRPDLTARWPLVALLATLMALLACGQEAATNTTAGSSGGLPDTPCSPQAFNEGCTQSPLGPVRMRCDPKTSLWAIIAACPPEHRCVEFPTLGGGVGLTTECRPLKEANAGSDTTTNTGKHSKLATTVGAVDTTKYLFSPGASGGDAKQQVVVLLESKGSAPLTINKLDWTTNNFSLQLKTLKGKPTMPMTMDVGTSFEVVILYTFDAAFPDTKGGILLIESDDPDLPSLKLQFDFAKAGGTLKPPSAAVELMDPEPGKGDQKCVNFTNTGDGDIAFEKAAFDKADKLWQVAKAPEAGAKLIAHTGGTHEFCIKVVPAGPKVDHTNGLTLHYADAINSPVHIDLTVKWDAVGDWQVKCEALDNKIVYDFTSGSAKAKKLCTLTNKIAEPLNLQSISVGTDEKGWETLVVKLFEVDPYMVLPGEGQVSFYPPKTLLEKESAFLPVTFYPDAAPIANAELRIGWTQGKDADTLKIPILVKP